MNTILFSLIIFEKLIDFAFNEDNSRLPTEYNLILEEKDNMKEVLKESKGHENHRFYESSKSEINFLSTWIGDNCESTSILYMINLGTPEIKKLKSSSSQAKFCSTKTWNDKCFNYFYDQNNKKLFYYTVADKTFEEIDIEMEDVIKEIINVNYNCEDFYIWFENKEIKYLDLKSKNLTKIGKTDVKPMALPEIKEIAYLDKESKGFIEFKNKMDETYYSGNVITFGEIQNCVWVSKNFYPHDIFMICNEGTYDGNLPHSLNINMKLSNFITINRHIFIIAVIENNMPILLHGFYKEFRFSQIKIENILTEWNGKEYIFKLFLPENEEGIALMNVKYTKMNNEETIKSFVSFDLANSWSCLKRIDQTSDDSSCDVVLISEETDINLNIQVCKNNGMIMISKGYIVNNSEKREGYLITLDGGYSWMRMNVDVQKINIFNHGEVLMGITNDKTKIEVSFDFGRNWITLQNTQKIENYLKIMVSEEIQKFFFGVITFENENKMYKFYSPDSSKKIMENICNQDDDYDFFTPGEKLDKKCFQGVKKSKYKKNSTKICEITGINSTKIKCDCTMDDFKCRYLHQYRNDRCFLETNFEFLEKKYACKLGELRLLNIKSLILGNDECIFQSEKFNSNIEEIDICGFAVSVSSAVFETFNKAEILLFDRYSNEISLNLFESLKFPKSWRNYQFQRNEKCAYILLDSKLIKRCWFSEEQVLSDNYEIIIFNKLIKNFKIDTKLNYLYYFNDQEVHVMNIQSRISKRIYTTENFINYLNVFAHEGRILISEVSNESSIITKILDGTGTVKKTVDIPGRIELSVLSETMEYHLYTNKNELIFKETDTQNPIMKDLPNYKILDIKIDQGGEKILSENGVYQPKRMLLYRRIHKGSLYFSYDDVLTNGCKYSNCEFLCVSKDSQKFECMCPDGFVLDSKKEKCIKDTTIINECQEFEFKCQNGVCINKIYLCNGENNCGDSSDENKCSYQCESNQLQCDNPSKCVDHAKICNGVNDCDDKKDEEQCEENFNILKKLNSCDDGQFQCNDHKCIDLQNLCDGKPDCHDGLDEDKCLERKCLEQGAYCDNGDCVDSSKICDGVFDCVDFSDEHLCSVAHIVQKNYSCILECDGKCIPSQKICDHVSDCENMEDEEENLCKFYLSCSTTKKNYCGQNKICYNADKNCDWFDDCSISEIYNCRDGDNYKCFLDLYFTCETGNQKICLYEVCDYQNDCDDGSDEKNCPDDIKFNYPDIFLKKKGNVKIDLIFENDLKNVSVQIEVFNFDENKMIFKQETDKNEIIMRNHKFCGRYVAKLIILEVNIVRAITYTYHLPHTDLPPLNVRYDRSKSAIVWKSENMDCIPYEFYIECSKNDLIISRNFTKNFYYEIKYVNDLKCKICLCSRKVYSNSCSKFTQVVINDDIKRDTYTHDFMNPLLMILSFGLFSLMIILIYMLMKKTLEFNSVFSRLFYPIAKNRA